MKKLRVCVVTGTRAEFGIWRPVLRAIQQSPRLELQFVVTGMHLLQGFGTTVQDIEDSGLPIAARVPMYRDTPGKNPEADAARSLARGIDGLAAACRQLQPGLVMLLGDRLEMLAAACAALAQRLPIAHLHGGETAPGIWDEQIRHAITKMAHLHFCATRRARQRIVRMGEEPARVHVVGAPALDLALGFFDEAEETARLDRRERGVSPVLVLHPSGGDEATEYKRAKLVLGVLKKVFPGDGRVTVVGPNNDPGHRGIVRAYSEQPHGLALALSLSQEGFWSQMMTGGLLVGNSSSGIIEAASMGVPVVNIGDRQAGRERNVNVIDVGWNAAEIEKALRRVLPDKCFARQVVRRKNIYGDGHASERTVAVLEKIAREGIALEKRFVDG